MADYETSLTSLQTAILNKTPETVIDLLGRKTPSLARRLDAYIDGYRIRLQKTVASDYPATKHYLGGDIFDALVSDYVEQAHSTSYTIDRYPWGFADYLGVHANNPAASAIALLESTISEVFWLPDSKPFVPAADFSMEQLMDLTLRHRTASKLLHLDYGTEAYLAAFRDEQAADIVKQDTFLFIVRHENHVRRHRLSRAQALLFQTLSGKPFAEALEQVMTNHPEHAEDIQTELGNWLGKWIQEGFFRVS